MKGDFTRFTFDPTKHYTRVLKQQGRVDLDADWNEQAEILDALDRVTRVDAIGSVGIPIHRPGFVISPAGDNDLAISAGRIYVDGILCEMPADKPYTYNMQPYLFKPPEIQPVANRTDLVYLDVWERHVTALEDPALREPALDGPDTTTRVQTVFQIRVNTDVPARTCKEAQLPKPSDGRLSTSFVSPGRDNLCETPLGGGYRGLENRLYRVEIHEGGDFKNAKFKWSRDNGAIACRIEEFVTGEEKCVRVSRLGRDQELAFRREDCVEVLCDEAELNGKPGKLVCVDDLDEANHGLRLSDTVSSYKNTTNPKIRRWDQAGDAIPVTSDWIDLEHGIRVKFSGDRFLTGDYWTFAARTATRQFDELDAAPPQGIIHHYAPLALVTWVEGPHGLTADIVPCSPKFPPLTELPVGSRCCCTITVGDGTHSHGDCHSLQQAIDRAANEKRPVQVCLLPGVHTLTRTVKIQRDDITIRGCQDAAPVHSPDGQPAFRVDGRTAVTFDTLSVESKGNAPLLIAAESKRLTIRNCVLKADKSAWVAAIQGEDIEVDRNRFDKGGLHIVDGSQRLRVTHNQFWKGSDSGIDLGGSAGSIALARTAAGVCEVAIVANRIEYFGQSGIVGVFGEKDDFGDLEDVTIAHNVIRGCARTESRQTSTPAVAGGIVLGHARFVRIHHNSITDNGVEKDRRACGIYAEQTEGLQVIHNTIRGNGTDTGAPVRHCVAFHRCDTGPGPNPREESNVQFQVFDRQGQSQSNSYIREYDSCRGLHCGYKTEITLPSPAQSVELEFVHAAYGPRVTLFAPDGTRLHEESLTDVPQNELIRIRFGPEYGPIGRVCIAPEKDETLLTEFCFTTSELKGTQGGIVVAGATTPCHPRASGDLLESAGLLLAGEPAVCIHGNTVCCPAGPALWVHGAGVMSITDNTLVSLAAHPLNPDQGSTSIVSVNNCGMAYETARTGLRVAVLSRVVMPPAASTKTLPFVKSLLPDALAERRAALNAGPADASVRPSPSPAALARTWLLDGRILFHGNQVTFATLDETPPSHGFPLVRFISNDDVSLQDNQFVAHLTSLLRVHVLVEAVTVRISSNRFAETPQQAYYSCYAAGGRVVLAGNQSSHCLGVDAAHAIVEHNQEIYATECRKLDHYRIAMQKRRGGG
ncbi:MAG: right-handed parallel beta-helix repeat-containing protein [Phycisphaerae bacterium]|nr:right-handed parallel beta-helix repeat-containing protein [Phycisphaerae bacterium]